MHGAQELREPIWKEGDREIMKANNNEASDEQYIFDWSGNFLFLPKQSMILVQGCARIVVLQRQYSHSGEHEVSLDTNDSIANGEIPLAVRALTT